MTAIHGTIPGARSGLDDGTRTSPAARVCVPYTCDRGHETVVPLAAGAKPALWWDCATCASPAALNGAPGRPETPVAGRNRITHMDQVISRRSPDWRRRALAEALDRFHRARDAGETP